MFQDADQIAMGQDVSSSANVGTEVNVTLRVGHAGVPLDGGDHSARNPAAKVTFVLQLYLSYINDNEHINDLMIFNMITSDLSE